MPISGDFCMPRDMDTSFCLEALLRHGCPEIFNTDQVSRFTGERPKRGMRPSHGQQGARQGLC